MEGYKLGMYADEDVYKSDPYFKPIYEGEGELDYEEI